MNDGLNTSVPHFLAYVRSEFLHNLESHQGEYEEVTVFGLASIPGRAIGWHVVTAKGAQFARLPIHALCWKQDAPPIDLHVLQIWDCFSYHVRVHEFDFLAGLRCSVFMKDREWYPGEYMFTVDWFGNKLSEDTGDNGHKNAHIVRLDNGCFAAQPNNRMRWHEPSFIVEQFPEEPSYLTNTHVWKCEQGDKWTTEDSDRFFYEYQETDQSEGGPSPFGRSHVWRNERCVTCTSQSTHGVPVPRTACPEYRVYPSRPAEGFEPIGRVASQTGCESGAVYTLEDASSTEDFSRGQAIWAAPIMNGCIPRQGHGVVTEVDKESGTVTVKPVGMAVVDWDFLFPSTWASGRAR